VDDQALLRHPVAGQGCHHAGFTLVELMIVIAILAVLLGVAAPAFRSFIVEQRLRATSADLRIAMMTARSEAVKRNRDVAVTPLSGDWSNGWEILNPVSGQPDILNHIVPAESEISVTLDTGSTVGFTAAGRAEESIAFEVAVGSGSYESKKCLQLELDGFFEESEDSCP
jgi:type IV fimbrial biogenesis protein FimT